MSQPDQFKIESQEEADSYDEDSIMEDVGSLDETAASDSQVPSEDSTRASTPTENHLEDVSANIHISQPSEKTDIADDVTTRALRLPKSSAAGTTDEFGSLKVVSWPSGTVIDPGTSPWKTKNGKEGSVDSLPNDTIKIRELLHTDDTDSPEL